MRQSAFDLVLLYAIGLLGVVMRRFDFPTAPVVVGMILGPLAEAQMRNALSIGEGKWGVFVERPMSVFLLVVIVAGAAAAAADEAAQGAEEPLNGLHRPRLPAGCACRAASHAPRSLLSRSRPGLRRGRAVPSVRPDRPVTGVSQPCRWRSVMSRSASIHSCRSFRQAM